MHLLRIVGASLVCLTTFSTPLPTIPFNFPFPLIRPSYGTMLQIAHITVTCILGYLLFKTSQQLKNLQKNTLSKASIQNQYVRQSYLENTVNEGIDKRVTEKASQTGTFWATKGQLAATEMQIAERATREEQYALEDRVASLEQHVNHLTQQLKALQTNKN